MQSAGIRETGVVPPAERTEGPGSLETPAFASVMDAAMLESMMKDFYRLTRIPSAIIDLAGNVVAGAGWQRVCLNFHRTHPVSCRNCVESDVRLTTGIAPGEFRIYKCRNSMWDVATPIMIGSRHVANLSSGQFFFEDEAIDENTFRAQAARYGWDAAEYLASLQEAPRLSRETVAAGMAYLAKVAQFLSQLSCANSELKTAVSKRDTVTRELKQSEDRLKRAQSIAHVGAWEFDPATDRFSWSDQVCRILGMKPGEFGGGYDALLAAVHPDDRAAVDAAYRESSNEGSGPYEMTHRVIRQDSGDTRWVRVKCEHARNEAGDLVLSVGMIQDITDHHLAEEQLRRKQKLESIGLLAAGVAHDFNNLLVGVLGNAGLAQELLGPEHPATKMLKSIVSASEKAADLTRQILAYAGKGRYAVEPFDLSALVRDIAGLVRASIPNHITVTLDLSGNLPLVEGDASQIQQVVMNLLINAAEAIGREPGEIALVTRREASCVRLEVRDNGCGMDAETQLKIFDPFFTTKSNGRGLGLAGVSGILRRHNAPIRVSSAPGKGTHFTILFRALSTRPPVAPATARNEADTRRGTILIVDDEALVSDLAGRALRRAGHSVLTAGSGREAIAICETHPAPIDAVLLDSRMPGMSGRETLPKLLRLRPKIRVILTSGYSEAEMMGLYAGQPVHAFIQKPYSAAALERQVQAALRGRVFAAGC